MFRDGRPVRRQRFVPLDDTRRKDSCRHVIEHRSTELRRETTCRGSLTPAQSTKLMMYRHREECSAVVLHLLESCLAQSRKCTTGLFVDPQVDRKMLHILKRNDQVRHTRTPRSTHHKFTIIMKGNLRPTAATITSDCGLDRMFRPSGQEVIATQISTRTLQLANGSLRRTQKKRNSTLSAAPPADPFDQMGSWRASVFRNRE